MISRPTPDQLWIATAVRRAACRRPASAAAQRSAEWARRLWREGPYPDDVIVALEALAPLAAGLAQEPAETGRDEYRECVKL